MTETKTRPGPQIDESVRQKYSGKAATIELEGLKVRVLVLDVRSRFGHTDFLITPAEGNGKRWVESSRASDIG